MRSSATAAVALLLLTVPLVGCIGMGDEDVEPASEDVPDTSPEPEDLLPEEITGMSELTVGETEGSGTGIWIDEARDLVLSSNGGGGLQIFDVADPDNVTKLGNLGEIDARDADLLEVDGTPYAVLAAGGGGIHVVDITDPRAPVLVATADEYSSHNLAAIPGTPYVYDSTGIGLENKVENPVIPVLDLSTPEDPAWTTFEIPAVVNGQPTQSDGCHDIVVRTDLDRAYCAGGGTQYRQGGGESFIWDISEDPTDPEWIGIVDNPSIVYHHQAIASEDGDLLYINDEHIESNCNGVDTPVGSVEQTTAAMWIYDISDPSQPEMLDYVQVSEEEMHDNCGSHFGDLVDGRDLVVWGWYQAGTVLIDVSDPTDATIVDRIEPDGGTWGAQYHEGHVYASSGNLQVLGFEGAE